MDVSNNITNNDNKKKTIHTSVDSASTDAKIIKKKNRCYFETCNKKIPFSAVKCRCGFRFCNKHRHAEDHDCSYDYRELGKIRLKKENPKIQFAKMEKI